MKNTLKFKPVTLIKLSKPKPSVAYDTYWRFATKRQEVFFNRIHGKIAPWSDDPILKTYKFTNCYRASDRVSQYLIQEVIYSGKWSLEDTVFRILLFKLFNKIETWQRLKKEFGDICLETFNIEAFEEVLNVAMQAGTSIYSAAYIIPSGAKSRYAGLRKHSFHLNLIDNLIKTGLPKKLHEKQTMKEAFYELLELESIGKFLAYQFITDLNYSEWFNYSETEFVVPGPGALDGIKKCFINLGDYSESDIIKLMVDEQEDNFDRLNCDFKSLWGRPLQLIDCQNLFCEVDKYSRVAHPDLQGISGRTRIKQKFTPSKPLVTPWYPPKWGINENIYLDLKEVEQIS